MTSYLSSYVSARTLLHTQATWARGMVLQLLQHTREWHHLCLGGRAAKLAVLHFALTIDSCLKHMMTPASHPMPEPSPSLTACRHDHHQGPATSGSSLHRAGATPRALHPQQRLAQPARESCRERWDARPTKPAGPQAQASCAQGHPARIQTWRSRCSIVLLNGCSVSNCRNCRA